MSVFRFRQFEVRHAESAMKVGTDSVLLGCLVQQTEAKSILDVGAGTGLLSLMMAQRFSEANIDAIEIEASAFREAKYNFARSSWKDRLNIYHQSFQDFATNTHQQYDLIISNPPYYKASENVKIEETSRSNARHDGELSFDDLLQGCSALLKENGSCWFVLPVQEGEVLLSMLHQYGLYINQRIDIYPKFSKGSNRIVLALGKTQLTFSETNALIYNEDGTYTDVYFELTKDFLLWENRI